MDSRTRTINELAQVLLSLQQKFVAPQGSAALTAEDLMEDAENLLRAVDHNKGRAAVHAPAAGRKPVHDREWAMSVLLDHVVRHPDGLPLKQSSLVDTLRSAFEASGRSVPGDTWLKATVRDFYHSAARFEKEAVQVYRASADHQAVFQTEANFLHFRRYNRALRQHWENSPTVRSQFPDFETWAAAATKADFSPKT